MVKNIYIYFIVILFIIILTIIFSGCSIKEDNQNQTIEGKITEEVDYIENKILTFFSMYAKGEYGELEKLNWDLIQENAIELNDVLDTVILDMSEVDVSNEDIIKFKNGINNLSIAVFNKDINEVFKEYGELYLLLPTFANKSYSNKNEIKLLELKSIVISSFVYANLLDWESAKNTINDAEIKYKTMMDDVDYMKEYSYNLNKVFILIGEMKNAIEIEEIELTKVKYVNFIEKI